MDMGVCRCENVLCLVKLI